MTPEFLLTIGVASFAPSLVFLGYYALKDRYEPEPLRLLLGVFAAGLLSAPIALIGFSVLSHFDFYANLSHIDEVSIEKKFAYTMLAIGPLEEMVKFVVVWATVYRYGKIDEPVDGMLYATAAALGFATYENWYAMVFYEDVLWARAFTLPFNHALFSSFWGYAIGRELCTRPDSERAPVGSSFVVLGLSLSFVYHGLYDFILVEETVADVLILPLVAVLWVWVQVALKRLVQASPFRPDDPPEGPDTG